MPAADPASSIMSSSRARRLAQRFTARGLSLRDSSRAAATKPSAAMSISGGEEGGCVKRCLSVGAVRVPNITYPRSIARLAIVSTPQGGNPDMAQLNRQDVGGDKINSRARRIVHSASSARALVASSLSAPCFRKACAVRLMEAAKWSRSAAESVSAKAVARIPTANNPGVGTDMRGVYGACGRAINGSQVAVPQRPLVQTVLRPFVAGLFAARLHRKARS